MIAGSWLEGDRSYGLSKQRRWFYRQRSRNRILFKTLICLAILGAVVMFKYFMVPADSAAGSDAPSSSRRRLMEDTSNYPSELFSQDELDNGAIILHIIGVLYMFWALAIVCDEFFVPSLEVVMEKMQLREDVAGATMMAAGGSAPELFTSFIGTFIAESNVGFGTIVGSAVFNILFVIGACAFFTSGTLALTWWPLFRDSVFYAIFLLVLVGFFENRLITWWEAAIMFGMYFGYVFFMVKYNEQAELWAVNLYKSTSRKYVGKDAETAGAVGDDGSSAAPGAGGDGSEDEVSISEKKDEVKEHPTFSHTSASEFDQERHRADTVPTRSAEPRFLSRMQTFTDQKARNIELGLVSAEEKKKKLRFHAGLLRRASQASLSGADKFADAVQLAVAKEKAKALEIEMEPDLKQSSSKSGPPESPDSPTNKNTGLFDVGPKEAERRATGHVRSDTAASGISLKTDPAIEEKVEEVATPEHNLEADPLSDTTSKLVVYLSAPIYKPMELTLPNLEENPHLFPISFIGSILWIAVFSYLMVWWSTTIGDTLGIPAEVMGVTFLAAGTSVPDLITSVIVAKKGFGDMALSSSIGSNIFDVAVGLPLPWLLKALIDGKDVPVGSDGLFSAVIVLFMMLVTVIILVALSGWVLSRNLGIAMFIMYIIFITQNLLIEYDVIPAI